MKLVKTICRNGTVVWRPEGSGETEYHREDAPASIGGDDGIAAWFDHGFFLRQDAPYWRIGMRRWENRGPGRPQRRIAGVWAEFWITSHPQFGFANDLLQGTPDSRIRQRFERAMVPPTPHSTDMIRIFENTMKEVTRRQSESGHD
jgi:hypothetical protein